MAAATDGANGGTPALPAHLRRRLAHLPAICVDEEAAVHGDAGSRRSCCESGFRVASPAKPSLWLCISLRAAPSVGLDLLGGMMTL